jgi:hypothetical protein
MMQAAKSHQVGPVSVGKKLNGGKTVSGSSLGQNQTKNAAFTEFA